MSWEDILKRNKRGRGRTRKKGKARKKRKKASSSRCTKRTGKTSSNRKGKKWMACVPAGEGKYKRVHWGQAGVKVTGKSGNTKRRYRYYVAFLRVHPSHCGKSGPRPFGSWY